MLNKQIPMKPQYAYHSELLVHSIFKTIQGEGIFAGEPCVFVRLGGCNLQCPACDTEYSLGSKPMRLASILEQIKAFMPLKSTLVVITGGEPMRQTIGPLIARLNAVGYRVQIETNGTLFDPTIDFSTRKVFIMCSPKTGAVNKKLQPYITAYKYVGGCDEIAEDSYLSHLDGRGEVLEDHGLMEDGLPRQALGHLAKPHLARPHAGFRGKVFLQPIDRQNDELNLAHQSAVVNSCLNNGYTLCLQIHKIINVE